MLNDFSVQPSASGFMTAMELGHQRKRVVKVSTGSKQFDAILNGYKDIKYLGG